MSSSTGGLKVRMAWQTNGAAQQQKWQCGNGYGT